MEPPRSQASPAHVRAFLERHRTGLLALVFTDVVGSTLLKQRLGDAAGVRRLQEHHAVFRETLAVFPQGQEISTAGDSFLLMFTKPSEAVSFALLAQARLRAQAQAGDYPLCDRIGIHVGEVFIEEAAAPQRPRDLYGIQVDTCARVMSLASADQILLTRFAFDNARQILKGREIGSLGELSWLNHGLFEVDGVEGTLEICEVGERGKACLRPPTTSKHVRRVGEDGADVVTGWRPALGQNVPGTQWVLQTKIADGMLGEVWLGRHAEFQEQRVFKFCFDGERVRALKREVALFRTLKERAGEHPNIVRLLEVYFDAPPYYIVTEYVEGQDLKSWWIEQKSLAGIPLAVRIEIVAQAADALQAAHDAGIIHCDVKPSNILIAARNGGASITAKLADFGIGQAISQEVLTGLTVDEAIPSSLADGSASSGTQLYLAPERLAGQPASIRSDIYSLGVVLYQLLADDLTRPLSVDWTRSVPDDLLRQDLERCFAGNPNERFSSAAEFAANLRHLDARRSQAARRREEITHRERAAYRRGIIRTASIALLALLVTAALAWLAVQGQKAARRATGQAELARNEALHETARRQRQLQRLNVAYGVRLMEEKDLLSAFQRSVNAWRIAEQMGDDSDIHRIRAASLLRHSPRLVQLWSFDEDVNDLAFSPDGRRLVSAHPRAGAKVWDVGTGQELLSLPHPGPVNFVSFNSAGNRILTSCPEPGENQWQVTLWDAETGQPVGVPQLFASAVTFVRFVGQNGLALAGTRSGRVRVWEAASGRRIWEAACHTDSISQVDVSADNTILVTSSKDGTVMLSRLDNGEQILPPIQVGTNVVRAVLSPDGSRLLTASPDWLGRIWDAKTGRLLHQLRHDSWLTDASFSPDGTRVLTTSFDTTARLWDAETGRPLCAPIRHEHSVMRGQFSRDGRRVLTGCFDQAARVWDAETGELLLSPLKHSGYVKLCEFDPEGRRLVTVGGDRIVRLWDLAADEPAQPSITHRAAVNSIAFSSDGRRIASGSDDRTARVWDAETRKPVGPPLSHQSAVTHVEFQPKQSRLLTLQVEGPAQLWTLPAAGAAEATRLPIEGLARNAAFSSDGRRVLVTTSSNRIGVFDPASGQPVSAPWDFGQPIAAAAFSPEGKRVALGLDDGRAGVFDALSGAPLTPWFTNASSVSHLEFSNDGHWVVAAASDATFNQLSARVWDASTGLPVTEPLPHFDGVKYATLSPGRAHLATASEDGTAAIWNIPGGTLAAPYLRHGYQVTRVAFNRDGRMLATASIDRTARVWETATGEPVTPPLRHAGRVNRAEFSPDGAWLATADSEGQVYFWDLRPITMSLSNCVAMGTLLNSRRLEAEGGPIPAGAEELRHAWATLKSEVPHQFAVTELAIRYWHYNEAQAARQARAWGSSLEHLDWLVTATPGAWWPYWQRARADERLGRWPEAVENYTRVLDLDPGHAAACRARGQIYSQHLDRVELGRVDEDRARHLLGEALPSVP